MDCVELQGCRFADCQERHFQAAKRSDKSSTILQERRFAHIPNSGFRVRNVEILSVLSSKEVDLLMLYIRVLR